MDHFNIPIGLIIGMCFVFPLLTNGQTTAQSTTSTASTTTASTGCKTAETNSPPEEGCTIVCGNQIYQAYTQICGSRRKRLASGTSTIFSSLPDKHFSKEFHILPNVPRKKTTTFFCLSHSQDMTSITFFFSFHCGAQNLPLSSVSISYLSPHSTLSTSLILRMQEACHI